MYWALGINIYLLLLHLPCLEFVGITVGSSYIHRLVPGPPFELELGTIICLPLSSYSLRFPEWSCT